MEVLQEGLANAEAKLKKLQAAASAKKAAVAAATGDKQARLEKEVAVAVASIASALAARDSAMNKAAENVYRSILDDGDQKAVIDTMQTRMDLYDYLGYHDYEQKLDSLFAEGKNK